MDEGDGFRYAQTIVRADTKTKGKDFMPQSKLRFIKRSAEFLHREQISRLKNQLRGIYVLYKEATPEQGKDKFDVRYVGMSAGKRFGMKGRLRGHKRSKRKGNEWTHFSVFEVWDNVTDQEIAELEGLARHIFRKDPTVKRTVNIQRGFKKLRDIKDNNIGNWV
jgi:hypothetical protein